MGFTTSSGRKQGGEDTSFWENVFITDIPRLTSYFLVTLHSVMFISVKHSVCLVQALLLQHKSLNFVQRKNNTTYTSLGKIKNKLNS